MRCSRTRRLFFTLPASATSCLRSNARPNIWTPMSRAPSACSNAPAPPRCGNSSTRRPRPAMAWPQCRPREDHPIAPEHPYALSKYQGETAVLHWHQVYRLPVEFDPHLQRLWAARAHHRGLWRGVRRVLQAEACGQAVYRDRRRHAAPRFPLRHRRRRRLPARGRNRASPARSGISAPAIRRASTVWSSFSAAGGAIFPSARASRTAPGRTSARSSAISAGSRRCRSMRASGA